jgi:phosphoenolpyruvate-protein kinase (PTS system EI component)
VLLGLGFTSLSVSLSAFPRIQQMIRSVSSAELRNIGKQLLRMQKPKDVEEMVRAAVGVTRT